MKKIRKIGLTLINISLCFLFIFSQSVSAADQQTGAIMQVAPVIEELSLDPASQKEEHITVTNQSDQDLKVRVYFAPYSISSQNGASDFESESEYTQIYHWLKVKDDDYDYKDTAEFTIKPNSDKKIYYRVNIPESAPGGSQHACIFVETIPDDEQQSGSITTVPRAAVKIFADVSGETIKNAEITSLNTNTLVIDGKVEATTTVKNTGNIDIKPTLTLKLSSLSGETIFSDTKVAMVFPEDEAEIKVTWPDTPAFGIYNLFASTNILGKKSVIEKTIVILPSWFIVLLLLIITAAIILPIGLKRKKRQASKLRAENKRKD